MTPVPDTSTQDTLTQEDAPAGDVPDTSTSNAPAGKVPDRSTSDAPAGKVPDTSTSDAPAGKVPDTSTSGAPAGKVPDTSTSDTPAGEVVEPFSSMTQETVIQKDAPAADSFALGDHGGMRKTRVENEATTVSNASTSTSQGTIIQEGAPAESKRDPTPEMEPAGPARQSNAELHTFAPNFGHIPLQPAPFIASPQVEPWIAECDSLLALLDGPLLPFPSGDLNMPHLETGTWNTLNYPATPTPSSWMFPSPNLFPVSQDEFLWPPMSTSQAHLPLQPYVTPQGSVSAVPTRLSTAPAFPVLASSGSEQPRAQLTIASPSMAALPPLVSWMSPVPATTLTTAPPVTEAVTSAMSKGNKRKACELAEGTKSHAAAEKEDEVQTTTSIPIPSASKKPKKSKEGKGEVLPVGNLRRSVRQPKVAAPMTPMCITDHNAPSPRK